MKSASTFKLVLTSLFAALTCVATMFLRIPSPLSGYLNLGDGFALMAAFLLGPDNRVPSDDWFVFYSQPVSPDGSVRFQEDGRTEREVITVDFSQVDPRIQRIVFVMTINEAKEKRLNFGMIGDAWLRVLDGSGREVLSYRPQDFYENITSMTFGEIYLRGGEWRFNPVGRGLDIDLAGQCAVYGVNISD